MSFILVIGVALTPRQGYEQCEGGHTPPPLFMKTARNTFQMNDEISQNKVLNIFLYIIFLISVSTFYILTLNT